MFDLASRPEDKIIETAAPISMENITKAIKDTEVALLIDYEKSLMKGRQLLVYLSNLNVACDIKFSEAVTKQERFDLIVEYMNFRNLIGCESLAVTVATILGAIKGIDAIYYVVQNPVLKHDEIEEFIGQNKDLVNTWRILMDSMIVFTMAVSKKFKEAFGDPKYQYPVIDDANIVGNNFVQLFSLPVFLEQYYSVPGQHFYYFTKQFEEYMYATNNLYCHFMVEGNPLPTILEMMGSVEYDVEDLIKSFEENEAKAFQE